MRIAACLTVTPRRCSCVLVRRLVTVLGGRERDVPRSALLPSARDDSDRATRDRPMLMRTAPSRRASERGQALLATLFVLGFLGLLTIAMLGYASSAQGQCARTEQTARQNASIAGAVDAGL